MQKQRNFWSGRRLRSAFTKPLLVVGLLALAAFLQAASTAVRSSRWLDDVKYLAGDALKGRGDGTPELERAAAYIAEQFQKAGLEPLRGSYFQPFQAAVGADLGPNNRFHLVAPSSRSYQLRRDFIPLSFSTSGEQTAGLAFVGYGITASEYHYDDYAGVEVRGKAVIVLRHEPQETEEQSLFQGKEFTRHAALVNKAINARNHGAVAMLLVNDPLAHREDQLVRFGEISGPNNVGLLVLQVKRTVVADWMKPAGQSLEGLQKAIDQNLSNHSFLLPETVQVKIRAEVNQRRSTLQNVLGYLPGSDPALRDQVIVLGAHYDHLGLGERDSLAPSQTGQIHHGADDNASGTAGLLELARVFSADRQQLRRSLLFLAFAGEELGLFGSAHYVEEPLLPLNRTVAMLNFDMIGRVRQDKLYVGGVGTSPEFRSLVEQQNRDLGFRLDFSDSGYDASDHMSFARKDVPVLFFFSGLHADYHKPSDTWDKLEPLETAKVLELAVRIVEHINQADAEPQFVRVPARERRARGGDAEGGPGYGPYFGSIPDFGETVRGVKFADVLEASPAAQAGLRTGDILVQFDGKEVQDLYDFSYLLRSKKPGDEVLVVVERSGQEIQATVKLGRRQ